MLLAESPGLISSTLSSSEWISYSSTDLPLFYAPGFNPYIKFPSTFSPLLIALSDKLLDEDYEWIKVQGGLYDSINIESVVAKSNTSLVRSESLSVNVIGSSSFNKITSSLSLRTSLLSSISSG